MRWITVLVTGSVLYAAVLTALLNTQDILYVPSLLLIGTAVVPVTQLLLMRSVLAPGGHAAWTGLACAALFAIGSSRRRWFGWAQFFVVFIGVVVLHATWDSVATDNGYFVVGGASFILLMAVTWYLHRHEVAQSPAPPGRTAGRWAPGPGTGLSG